MHGDAPEPRTATVQEALTGLPELLTATVAVRLAVEPEMLEEAGRPLMLMARLPTAMIEVVALAEPELFAELESVTCCGLVALSVTVPLNVWLDSLEQTTSKETLTGPLAAGAVVGFA